MKFWFNTSIRMKLNIEPLDAIDLKILNLLQSQADISNQDLAANAGGVGICWASARTGKRSREARRERRKRMELTTRN